MPLTAMGEVGGTFDMQHRQPRDAGQKLGQRQSVDANQRPLPRTVLEEVKEQRVIQSAGKQGPVVRRTQPQSQVQILSKNRSGLAVKPPSSSGLVSVKSQTQSMKDLH